MINLKEIRKMIIANKLDYIKGIIAQIWKKNPEDYNISYNRDDFFRLDNFTVIFDVFELVENENISEDIFNEFYDWISMWFESERYKGFNQYKNWYYYYKKTLKAFNLYCKDNIW